MDGHERLRADAAAALGAALDVRSVEFRELRTDEAYLEALRSAIAADLGAFDADAVDEVVRKYLGSRIHVREPQRGRKALARERATGGQ